jgi:hypothetical protein
LGESHRCGLLPVASARAPADFRTGANQTVRAERGRQKNLARLWLLLLLLLLLLSSSSDGGGLIPSSLWR